MRLKSLEAQKQRTAGTRGTSILDSEYSSFVTKSVPVAALVGKMSLSGFEDEHFKENTRMKRSLLQKRRHLNHHHCYRDFLPPVMGEHQGLK